MCRLSTWSLFSNLNFDMYFYKHLDFISVINLVFQYSQHKQEINETLNHHHNCSNMQRDFNLKEEMLTNKSIDCKPSNELLEYIKREQDRWDSETNTILDSSRDTGMLQRNTMSTELHYYLLFLLWSFEVHPSA